MPGPVPRPLGPRNRPGSLATRAQLLAIGAVASLGHEPFGFWPATLLGIALALPQIAAAMRPTGAFGRALLVGAGYFAVALAWIVDPFLVEPQVTGWMAPFALVLMALGGGLFWAVPAGLAAALTRGAGRPVRIAALALALLLSEWARGWIFTGFPWAQPGQAWVGTPVAQLAAFVGQLGLTALTLLAAALPGLTGRRRGTAAAALLLVLAWGAGALRLAQPLPPDTGLVVRLVQPDADQALKWSPEWSAEFYRRLIAQSAAPAEGRRPDVVIWPETATSFLLNDAGPALPQMAASAGGAPLLTGIQRAEGLRWFNSLVAIDPAGAVTAVYDKFHLVPFGEYIPFGDAMGRVGIAPLGAQQGFGYSAGPGPQVLDIPGLPPVQPLICYEAVFPQHLRSLGRRPGWLVQVTNDAWFGRFSGPWQHLAQARLRAIETGLPLMRAANTGISAAIDPLGRVTRALGLGVQGKLDAPLPAALPPTPWLRVGDGPLALLAALLLGVAALNARHSRRHIDGGVRRP